MRLTLIKINNRSTLIKILLNYRKKETKIILTKMKIHHKKFKIIKTINLLTRYRISKIPTSLSFKKILSKVLKILKIIYHATLHLKRPKKECFIKNKNLIILIESAPLKHISELNKMSFRLLSSQPKVKALKLTFCKKIPQKEIEIATLILTNILLIAHPPILSQDLTLSEINSL
jgi:hypothetical protein